MRIRSEVLYLDKSCFEVHVLCPKNSWLYEQLQARQIPVCSINPNSYWQVARYLWQKRVRVLHLYSTQSLVLSLIAKYMGIEVVLTLSGHWKDHHPIGYIISTGIGADFLIASNRSIFRRMSQHWLSQIKPKQLVPTGMDLRQLRTKSESDSNHPIRQVLQLRYDDFIVATMTNSLDEHSRVALQAERTINDPKLKFITISPCLTKVSLIGLKGHERNVPFAFKNPETVIADVDILYIPSHLRRVSTVAAMMAMAVGTRVVANPK